MFNVIKRDGEVAAFQLSKITQAIEKAFQAQEKQYTPDMMEMLGLRVTADFQNKCGKCPDPVRLFRSGKSLYSLPQTERKSKKYEIHDSGL